jgi:hypothetical protein
VKTRTEIVLAQVEDVIGLADNSSGDHVADVRLALSKLVEEARAQGDDDFDRRRYERLWTEEVEAGKLVREERNAAVSRAELAETAHRQALVEVEALRSLYRDALQEVQSQKDRVSDHRLRGPQTYEAGYAAGQRDAIPGGSRICDAPACMAPVIRRDDGARYCSAGHPLRWVAIDDQKNALLALRKAARELFLACTRRDAFEADVGTDTDGKLVDVRLVENPRITKALVAVRELLRGAGEIDTKADENLAMGDSQESAARTLAAVRTAATEDDHSYNHEFCGSCSSGTRGRDCLFQEADRIAHRYRRMMAALGTPTGDR